MVFYLKYRPQTINELDTESVRIALFQVLSLPQIPHAFLFTGPKGLGKTSAARILAKAVNCENNSKFKVQSSKLPKALEPCNACEQCISITQGNNLDILEIDAASNRGIDEIRDLRDRIKLSPISAKMKVYIIDEVHMLTTEAFNALLKTLEEPPNHAMFILCTTEHAKVPVTIQSRCFQIKFLQATKEDIARSFKRIKSGEKLKITDEAINEIAKLADGGFRDAHKILEELTAAGEKEINIEQVESKYKVLSIRNKIISILKSVEEGDVKGGLEIIKNLSEEGIDFRLFTQKLAETVHDVLLKKAGVKTELLEGVEDIKMNISELKEFLVELNKAMLDMKFAVLAQLPLELVLIDRSKLNKIQEIEPENNILNAKGKLPENQSDTHIKINSKANTGADSSSVTVSAMRKKVGDLARVKALYGEEKPVNKVNNIKTVRDFSLLNVSNSELTKEWIDNFWHVYILEIKQYNHTIAGVLRSCKISKLDKNELIIETAFKFHKERLSDNKAREVLEKVCKLLTGNPVSVSVVLKQ